MKKRCLGRPALASLIWLGFAASLAASPPRPTEEPPADFAGRQYIDSAGCVFTRDGKVWAARLGRDGGPVCGYPPTPTGRVPEQGRPATVPLDGMGSIEADLVLAVTAEMRAGDLQSDDQRRPDGAAGPAGDGSAEGPGGDVQQAIIAAIAAAPAVDNAATAGLPRANPRLCSLLGLDAGPHGAFPNGDPTGGYCSGLGAAALTPRIAAVERAARHQPDAAASGAGRSRNQGAAAPVARAASSTRTPPAAKPGVAAGTTAANEPRPPTGTRLDLVPAGTRFLEVGTFPEERSAQAALRRVAGLGLPVARSRTTEAGTRVVLAGPFHSREAVVRAHDRLTRAGFTGLRPRR